MSGRDLKKFVNFHRSSIGSSDTSLVSRLSDGHGSNRYKPVDYGKLQAFTQIKRASGEKTLQKIEKITEQRKVSKEHNLLQQHKSCWFKEQIRLNSLLKKFQSEVDGLRPDSSFDSSTLKSFFKDLETYEDILNAETQEFKKCTIDPVKDLQEDLQFWLSENRERLLLGQVDQEHSNVLEVIKSVKMQQKSVMKQLNLEKQRIEEELDTFSAEQLIVTPSLTDVIKTGIPDEALELECPDDKLRESVFEEFNLLDRKYEAHLEFLSVKYADELSCSYGGWFREDHFHFVCLMDQYPSELPNRRALYIDRMLREMPHKGRAELVEHENWLLAHKSYQSQRHSILRAWSKDREDLLLKVKATFADAWTALEDHMQKLHTRQQQQKICQELYEKVLSFREQKLEALQLQAAIAARQEEEEKASLKAAQVKEKQRREKIKEKIKTYEEQKMKEIEETALRERQRLEELQIKLAEQAELDKERVKFREEKLKEKETLKKEAMEKAMEAEKEKERRLDKLREQVGVHVEADPERVLRPTQATQARHASVYDDELELQQPLFNVYGYEDRKVSSDPRLRMEQALRSAGLHQSEYARKILANVQPPQQPRKDQLSSVFKYD